MRLIDADELENYLRRLIKVTQERIKKQEKDHYWGTSTPVRLDERREFLSLIASAPTILSSEFKLKPCQYCGHEPHLRIAPDDDLTKVARHAVRCDCCGVSTPYCTDVSHAVEVWNKEDDGNEIND